MWPTLIRTVLIVLCRAADGDSGSGALSRALLGTRRPRRWRGLSSCSMWPLAKAVQREVAFFVTLAARTEAGKFDGVLVLPYLLRPWFNGNRTATNIPMTWLNKDASNTRDRDQVSYIKDYSTAPPKTKGRCNFEYNSNPITAPCMHQVPRFHLLEGNPLQLP